MKSNRDKDTNAAAPLVHRVISVFKTRETIFAIAISFLRVWFVRDTNFCERELGTWEEFRNVANFTCDELMSHRMLTGFP